MPSATARLWNSLSLKVLGAYLFGVLLSILLIGLGLVALLTYRAEVLDMRVAWQARKLAAQMKFDKAGIPTGFGPSDDGIDWMYRSFKDELAYRVLDESGRPVLHSPAGEHFWSTSGSPLAHLERGHFEFDREDVLILVATEPVAHGGRVWFLQYAGSARMSDLFQIQFALPFMGAGIALFSTVLLVVFGACSLVTLRRTFKPLHELSASAAAISPSSLNARLRVSGVPSEVAPLVESFNCALERLEHGYRLQQEFLASAAHELKTPLALIRLQIERTRRGADGDALIHDVEHMARQIQQLLLLAEASEAQNYHFIPVDVLEVAREAGRYLAPMTEAADVRVEFRAGSVRPTWLADRSALFTLVKNLIENAVQHAPRGTAVSVEATVGSLSVRDRGPGANDEQLSRMFVRFWRGEHRRDVGAGLGLPICQEIARAHGWSLAAQRAEPGLRLVVSRPDPRGSTLPWLAT